MPSDLQVLAKVSLETIKQQRLKSRVAARVASGKPSAFQRQLGGIEAYLGDTKDVEVLSDKDLKALKDRALEFEVMIDECLIEEGIETLLGCKTIGRSIAKLNREPALEDAVVRLEDALITHAVQGAKRCLCAAPKKGKAV